MSLDKKPYKGARDFYPSDKRLQKFIFNKWRETVESYGYEEYDAPIIEPLELYLAKSGQEIVKDQTYVFKDRANREVVIRPEMTPSVSRLVASKRQELSYPLRWYSIPNLWRYERPQSGRLREHWQLNVDIFGVDSIYAEIELIEIVDSIFKSFSATSDMYEIRLNHRELIDHYLVHCLDVKDTSAKQIYKLIDKKSKMDKQNFISALDELLSAEAKKNGLTEKILIMLSHNKLSQLPEEVKKTKAYTELADILAHLKQAGINNVVYDPGLMRGFDYYTGPVFEVFDSSPDNNRSMMGGGRYDGLVGLFGVAKIATAGFGLGDVTFTNFLKAHHLLPNLGVDVHAYMVLIGDVYEKAQPLLQELRRNGINIALDLTNKKLGDQFKNAEKKGLNRVIIIGGKELNSGKYKLRDLKLSSENSYDKAALIKRLKS